MFFVDDVLILTFDDIVSEFLYELFFLILALRDTRTYTLGRVVEENQKQTQRKMNTQGSVFVFFYCCTVNSIQYSNGFSKDTIYFDIFGSQNNKYSHYDDD